MKKAGIFVSLLIFLFCLIAGYELAAHYSSATRPGTPSAVPTHYLQRNIVLIQVDNLQSPKPQLISIWVLFIYFSDPPRLTFLPIYPGNEHTASGKSIVDSFSVNMEGKISPAFWKTLESYRFSWEGYAMLDHHAIQRIGYSLGGSEFSQPSPTGLKTSVPTAQAAKLNEALVLRMCYLLGQPIPTSTPILQPSDLIPAHLRTDLKLETVITDLSVLRKANLPIRCEILPVQKASP